jgi:hypothetical protein
LKIKAPLAISAEPWLEESGHAKFNQKFWKEGTAIIAANKGWIDNSTQNEIWAVETKNKQIQLVEDAFEKIGPEVNQLISNDKYITQINVSTLGQHPFIRMNVKKDNKSVNEIIRLDGTMLVRQTQTDKSIADQYMNIYSHLQPLATEHIAFLAITHEGDGLFIDNNAKAPISIKFPSLPSEHLKSVFENWLATKKPHQIPKLIIVRENNEAPYELPVEVQAVLEGRLKIFEDDVPELAIQNINAQKKILSGSDLAVFTDSTIRDGKILVGLERALASAKIDLVAAPMVIPAGNLIIVTGHKAANFRNFLSELASKGTLVGKAVALLSCAEESDVAFCRYLIEKGKATCVIRMKNKINSSAARNVILEIIGHTKILQKDGLYFDDLLKEAVKAAENNTIDPFEKAKLHSILDNVMQVSIGIFK